ncbi:MAG: ribulose-phosphate 3-epimerase [Pseudodesulfovibrio sp.]|uniref:Ribulose-phosphate 3-epimerase n=1 Tax=Pseudodesulfovibrio aespoeensis (strain ATCC 700646 / DSM 10631 / Aspo-2) TaxID=643562 RepID=E6VVJ2_PSEA9|nr:MULTISPECIES: ribulose-phosphate 3-epimerase [Pseudodesulfovibrio]ADU63550.1 ribulose-phosphate 3-epimerase [Pseudodesulfovibrio aespoeensis Aspo-2]MBV1764798.1 ribulose-phosphate 3-epimerase [Pseudodesulfovibrio sp.]MBV1772165.1 ribulose-phosphate 3-epimerase [Pseudodesulfovibrio sp.]
MSNLNTVIISPSLLSSDFSRLAEELSSLEQAGVEWVHWDVMDGNFVPNITFGPPVIGRCRKVSNLFFDVHLMIDKPGRYIQEFVDAGADLICVHAESEIHLERTVAEIARLGARPAVAINPHTPLSVVQHLLPQLYMVLIMSVNPGFGGQSFIPFSIDKIRGLSHMIKLTGADTLIQVDGGVTPDNVAELHQAGADVFVSGSAFFGHPPYDERLKTFMAAACSPSSKAGNTSTATCGWGAIQSERGKSGDER